MTAVFIWVILFVDLATHSGLSRLFTIQEIPQNLIKPSLNAHITLSTLSGRSAYLILCTVTNTSHVNYLILSTSKPSLFLTLIMGGTENKKHKFNKNNKL